MQLITNLIFLVSSEVKQLIYQNKSLHVRLSLFWLHKTLFRFKYLTTGFKLRIFHYWGIVRETNEITELFIIGITSEKICLYSENILWWETSFCKTLISKVKTFFWIFMMNKEIGTCQILGPKFLALYIKFKL